MKRAFVFLLLSLASLTSARATDLYYWKFIFQYNGPSKNHIPEENILLKQAESEFQRALAKKEVRQSKIWVASILVHEEKTEPQLVSVKVEYYVVSFEPLAGFGKGRNPHIYFIDDVRRDEVLCEAGFEKRDLVPLHSAPYLSQGFKFDSPVAIAYNIANGKFSAGSPVPFLRMETENEELHVPLVYDFKPVTKKEQRRRFWENLKSRCVKAFFEPYPLNEDL
jgi:hypothetical protein